MPANINNQDVELLLDEIVALTGESETEAVRRALAERRERLLLRASGDTRRRDLRAFFETEVWPRVPVELLGTRLTKTEEETLLGYGEAGA